MSSRPKSNSIVSQEAVLLRKMINAKCSVKSTRGENSYVKRKAKEAEQDYNDYLKKNQ